MPSFKTTDDLFENVPVAQIETTLRQTRARAEAKKEELRQLVESRYKDLLEAAEVISTLLSDTDKLGQAITEIREASNNLVAPPTEDASAVTSGRSVPVDSHKELYQYAQMVNFLLDSPEQMWTHLEGAHYASAAVLYLQSERVYAALSGPQHTHHQKRVPPSVWHQQWSYIECVPPAIVAATNTSLRAIATLPLTTLEPVAQAVAARLALLSTGLTQEVRGLLDHVSASLTAISDQYVVATSLVAMLATIAKTMRATYARIECLFLHDGGRVFALLNRLLDEVDKASRFGAALDPGLDITSSPSSPSTTTTSSGSNITSTTTSHPSTTTSHPSTPSTGVTENFLERVRLVRCFQRHAGGGGGRDDHAGDLAERLQGLLDEWVRGLSGRLQANVMTLVHTHIKDARALTSLQQELRQACAPGDASNDGTATVLQPPAWIWSELFERAVSKRASDLIKQAALQSKNGIKALLHDRLTRLGRETEQKSEQNSEKNSKKNPEEKSEENPEETSRDDIALNANGRPAADPGGAEARAPPTPVEGEDFHEVAAGDDALVRAFDVMISELALAIKEMATLWVDKDSKSNSLLENVEQACFAAVEDLIAHLTDTLVKAPSDTHIDAAAMLGRVSYRLAQSRALEAFVLSAWSAEGEGGDSTGPGLRRREKLRDLQEELRRLGALGLERWAAVTSSDLCDRYKTQLDADTRWHEADVLVHSALAPLTTHTTTTTTTTTRGLTSREWAELLKQDGLEDTKGESDEETSPRANPEEASPPSPSTSTTTSPSTTPSPSTLLDCTGLTPSPSTSAFLLSLSSKFSRVTAGLRRNPPESASGAVDVRALVRARTANSALQLVADLFEDLFLADTADSICEEGIVQLVLDLDTVVLVLRPTSTDVQTRIAAVREQLVALTDAQHWTAHWTPAVEAQLRRFSVRSGLLFSSFGLAAAAGSESSRGDEVQEKSAAANTMAMATPTILQSFSLIPGVAIQVTAPKDPLSATPKKRTIARTADTQRRKDAYLMAARSTNLAAEALLAADSGGSDTPAAKSAAGGGGGDANTREKVFGKAIGKAAGFMNQVGSNLWNTWRRHNSPSKTPPRTRSEHVTSGKP